MNPDTTALPTAGARSSLCPSVSGPSARHDDAVAFLMGRINYERAPSIPYSERTLKLARMHELLDRLGRPDAGMPIVHIAGTKGKGSTAAMIASMLTAANHRTGVFSSPHLDRIEERFAVDGRPCSGDQLVDLVDRVRPIVRAMDADATAADGGLTYFELTTAIALLHFAEQQVDVAVLEVGLGGRLDSTNVCRPTLCVITSISFDHMKQLGNSLASIAAEKAGIIKPGVPVVSGVRQPQPQTVIATRAKEAGAPLIQLGRDFDFCYELPASLNAEQMMGWLNWHDLGRGGGPLNAAGGGGERYGGLPAHAPGGGTEAGSYGGLTPPARRVGLPLLGEHQAANAAVAIAAVRELHRHGWSMTDDAISNGLANVRIPARIEVLRDHPVVLVDAAHNVASAKALADVLTSLAVPGRRWLMLAATLGKDVPGIVRELLPRFDRVVITQYENNPRAMPTEELTRYVAEAGEEMEWAACPTIDIARTPNEAWRHVEASAGQDDLVCATGSFFIASEIRRLVVGAP